MASGDKFYIADKATLDEVKGKIGSTTDTGGSSTAGTMMAKENAILGEVGKLGATNDAQSSSITTGSIFAKLNYLVNQISLYLSNIFTRIGAQADSNNTGSKSSSAHGKLNWFIDLFGKTDDDGGSLTAGSVMAKANRLISTAGTIVEDGKYYTPNILVTDIVKRLETTVPTTVGRIFLATDSIIYTKENFGKKIIAFNATTLAQIGESITFSYEIADLCLYQDKLFSVVGTKIITFNPTTLSKLDEVDISGDTSSGSGIILVHNDTIYVNNSASGAFKVFAYDAATFTKKAESPIQQGYSYSIFCYDNTLYYADTTAKKVIAFNATTLAKTGETIALDNLSFGIFVYNDILYCPDITAKILTIFDANSLMEIHKAPVDAQMVKVKDNTLFYNDFATKKVSTLDAKTLIKIGEANMVQTSFQNGYFAMSNENIYTVDSSNKLIKYEVSYSAKNYKLGGTI